MIRSVLTDHSESESAIPRAEIFLRDLDLLMIAAARVPLLRSKRREVLVAEAEVQCEVPINLPVVLHIVPMLPEDIRSKFDIPDGSWDPRSGIGPKDESDNIRTIGVKIVQIGKSINGREKEWDIRVDSANLEPCTDAMPPSLIVEIVSPRQGVAAKFVRNAAIGKTRTRPLEYRTYANKPGGG